MSRWHLVIGKIEVNMFCHLIEVRRGVSNNKTSTDQAEYNRYDGQNHNCL